MPPFSFLFLFSSWGSRLGVFYCILLIIITAQRACSIACFVFTSASFCALLFLFLANAGLALSRLLPLLLPFPFFLNPIMRSRFGRKREEAKEILMEFRADGEGLPWIVWCPGSSCIGPLTTQERKVVVGAAPFL